MQARTGAVEVGEPSPRGDEASGELGRAAEPLRVAYLVNRYPRTSHSFIRRELRAVEALGVRVLRYSQRPLDEPLPDPEDRQESACTRAILSAGMAAHLRALARVGFRSPARLARAVALAVRIGRRSDTGLLKHLVYLAEASVLLEWVRAERVHHLHAHFGTNSASVAMLCHALGGPPFSFTVHGPDEFDKPEFLALREKIARASFVVAISSYGRSQLFRWARPEDWPGIEVVRCGVDAALLGAAPIPVPDVPRFVCVARLGEQQGHLVLVEAAARLASEGREFEILLVGDGPLRPRIEEAVHRAGLDGRIKLLGWLSGQAVREVVEGARAMVLPSFAEGLPVVLMEALALGRPVITTCIAGIPELVEPGKNGWLVPPGDVEALARAMRTALATPPARLDEMGRAGAARVAELHDVRREARKLAELFNRREAAWAPSAP